MGLSKDELIEAIADQGKKADWCFIEHLKSGKDNSHFKRYYNAHMRDIAYLTSKLKEYHDYT